MESQMYASAAPNFQVRMLKFMESGTYNPQYRRPYKTHMDPMLIGQFQEATDGGATITSEAISGIAGSMLRPNAMVSEQNDQILIPNGWQERRLMFVMEVVYNTNFTGQGVRQMITGWTDYLGTSVLTPGKVRLDPAMRMYLNSVMTIRATQVVGPNGPYIQEVVMDDSQFLHENYQISAGGFMQGQPMYAVSMRPQDVFHSQQVNPLQNGVVIDGRSNFSGGLKKSNRAHAIAADYVANVAKAWQSVAATGEDENYEGATGAAAKLVRDGTLVQERFVQVMDNAPYLKQGGYITYGELMYKQPGLDDNITEVFLKNQGSIIQLHEAGQTDHWHGAHHEWVYATVLFQAVPAIMLPLMISRLQIKVTNRTVGNQWLIVPIEHYTFQRTPVDDYHWNMFCSQLIHNVLNDLTMRGEQDVAFDLIVDVLSESRISIEVGGSMHRTTLVQPSFADAKLAPVIANNPQLLTEMAFDMSKLCANINVPMLNATPGLMGAFASNLSPMAPGVPAQPTPSASPTFGGVDPTNLQRYMSEV